MQHPNLPRSHLLTNEMDINLNMLHVTVMDRIGCHVDHANIVTVDHDSRGEGNMELLKQLAQPTTLGHNMSNYLVLSLSTRARDCSLAFRGSKTPDCHRDTHSIQR
jgi:hypothetical protein